jgi:lipopolysaccharide transport system ATP-binding protein
VGTGFHPELTGRENIYLNGAILGMKKWEIDKKIDEIIDFSGVEKFIDTPVKRYSSGMYVRLAFAVAAHLDPEILVVDEVLAVGDAEFQKKCLGKMDDVSKKEGRTVLVVSHNMVAIRQLCDRGVLLKDGKIVFTNNNINLVVNEYLGNKNKGTSWKNTGNDYDNPYFKPLGMEFLNKDGGRLPPVLDVQEEYIVKLSFQVEKIEKQLYFDLCFYHNDTQLFTAAPCEFIKDFSVKYGVNEVTCRIPANIFNNTKYRIELRA